MSKNKYLTCDERLQIEDQLNQGSSIKKIARIIGKCSSTVSREICKHAISSNKSAPYRIPNRCIHRFDCSKSYLCQDKPKSVKLCRTCRFCNIKTQRKGFAIATAYAGLSGHLLSPSWIYRVCL